MASSRTSPLREEARAFWAGPPLSLYEELSLRSVLGTGARVFLYTNNMDLRVPAGVELVDVRDLLPQKMRPVAYQDGDLSLTPYSDLFRYAALERYGGWYFDLDIICNKAQLPQADNYLARENDRLINAAVMKFPAKAPLLTAALAEAARLWPEAGRMTIGPELMTRLLATHNVGDAIRPRTSAFEIGWDEILPMFDPQARGELDERVSGSDFIHLWNEIWRRIRIPKNYGPPSGSFIDGLFKRFDISFADDARLSVDAIETWIRERQILEQAALQTMGAFQGKPSPIERSISLRRARSPQTVQTFCGGSDMNAYQLLCLKSFADRGHRVEVFSYEAQTDLPRWLKMKDAADILPPDRVMRYLPEQERFEINADRFRCKLLHSRGGWWIDPDVVLLGEELPADSIFASGPTEFGEVATAAMKLPAGHGQFKREVERAAGDDQGTVGIAPVNETFSTNGIPLSPPEATNSLSWFDVARLFDPAEADDIERRIEGQPFLDLHLDAWLRAGIPVYLGPPPGSFLDRLFARHRIGRHFAEQMVYDDVRRWLSHMYACVQRSAIG